jgi:hypothetical protein
MKIIIILLSVILSSFNLIDDSVYICGIKGAKKYHYTESCRGLGACKHEIIKVSLQKAQGYDLTLCGWED